MENVKVGMLEGLVMRSQNLSFKSLFNRKINANAIAGEKGESSSPSSLNSPRPIPQLSPLANSVVSRCSRILQIPTEELQHRFDTELPESVKELLTYARNFLEFCSYQALNIVSGRADYLSDKEFQRLTFDMMLAWEAPSVESEQVDKETATCSNEEVEEDDGWSLFYSSSTNMAVQVDEKKTVGREAFARIAPVCAPIADIITVHNLFDALTSSSCHRLHFIVYEKYIKSLDKVVKAAKNALAPSIGNLELAEGEIILDVDGTIPTQPVLQHIGITAWPEEFVFLLRKRNNIDDGGNGDGERKEMSHCLCEFVKPKRSPWSRPWESSFDEETCTTSCFTYALFGRRESIEEN